MLGMDASVEMESLLAHVAVIVSRMRALGEMLMSRIQLDFPVRMHLEKIQEFFKTHI